jgi:alkylhydroperoxidase/carboxymuconolactone decarboxylase family protein YurZ
MEVSVDEMIDAVFAAGMQVRREMFGPDGAEEIRETLLHTAVYAGVPCGVEAFNAAAEVLARHTASPP